MKSAVGRDGEEGMRVKMVEKSEIVRWRLSSVTGSEVGRFAAIRARHLLKATAVKNIMGNIYLRKCPRQPGTQ